MLKKSSHQIPIYAHQQHFGCVTDCLTKLRGNNSGSIATSAVVLTLIFTLLVSVATSIIFEPRDAYQQSRWPKQVFVIKNSIVNAKNRTVHFWKSFRGEPMRHTSGKRGNYPEAGMTFDSQNHAMTAARPTVKTLSQNLKRGSYLDSFLVAILIFFGVVVVLSLGFLAWAYRNFSFALVGLLLSGSVVVSGLWMLLSLGGITGAGGIFLILIGVLIAAKSIGLLSTLVRIS
jgi:hypothetical protein